MKRFAFLCLTVLAVIPVLANVSGPFKLTLKAPSECFILGENVEFDLFWENAAPAPLSIAFFPTLQSPALKIKINGGARSACCVPKFMGEQIFGSHTGLKGGERLRCDVSPSDYGIIDAGEYEIWAEYDASTLDPAWGPDNLVRQRTESNHVRFKLTEPTGADRQVFDKNHDECNRISLTPQGLLARFPTSTYAACVIYQRMSWTGGWEPTERNKSLLVGSLETGSFLSNSYPDDTGQSKDGWRSMKGEEAAAWWDKWITIILKNHPCIWFADELRLKRALDQIALRKYDAGAADLKTLARDAKEPVASRAKLIIDLIREKGWTNPKALTSTPPTAPATEKEAPASSASPAPTKPPVGKA